MILSIPIWPADSTSAIWGTFNYFEHRFGAKVYRIVPGWWLRSFVRKMNFPRTPSFSLAIHLAKLEYFTNLGLPEIREFPFLSHHLGWGRVRSLQFDQIHTGDSLRWTFASWWLNQPIWKICSSNWIISPGSGEHTKYLSCHHPVW